MSNFKFKSAEDFNPSALGKSLCMDFDAVVSSFTDSTEQRINGALSSYIYDVPQYPGDPVDGGIHYSRYVQQSTSLIPQQQPPLLTHFASTVREYVGPGASFFDLGPGPEWSVKKNTLPSLQIINPAAYFAVDIEREFTEEASRTIALEFPSMQVQSIAVDFHREVLPYPKSGPSIVWYPGSTLGNLPAVPNQAFVDNPFVARHLRFLQAPPSLDSTQVAAEHYLVILMDSRKSNTEAMVNLYTSPEARGCFISILSKLKRDLQATAFRPDLMTYTPQWNPLSSAVEHTFTALETQEFDITDCFTGRQTVIKIHQGERYVLANSLKPSHTDMRQILVRSGWEPLASEQDIEGQFHIHLARATSHA